MPGLGRGVFEQLCSKFKGPQTRSPGSSALPFCDRSPHQDWLHLPVACFWCRRPLHKHKMICLHFTEWVAVVILLTIFISSYLTWGVWSDTGEFILVNFKYHLILQTSLLMLAVIRGRFRAPAKCGRPLFRAPNVGTRVHLRLLFQSHRKK